MLNHKNRKPIVHIFTMDTTLAEDVYKRLKRTKAFTNAQIILPRTDKEQITLQDIESKAMDTLQSRLIIFDVRSQSLVRLSPAYNKIVGYNRCDFNLHCWTILIGDGPNGMFDEKTDTSVFRPLLAKLRTDFGPAAFFYDPLLMHHPDEDIDHGIGQNNDLPGIIPERIKPFFAGKDMPLNKIRKYYRVDNLKGDERKEKMAKRLKTLAKAYKHSFNKYFSKEPEKFKETISQQGMSLPGEMLPMNTYPFHFEKLTAMAYKKKLLERSA